MKRAWALILCFAMITTVLCGCTTLEKSEDGSYDKGAIIPMYIGTEMYNFDPGIAYLNDSNAKILSMLYVGLTDIDEKGKLQMTLIDKYEISENEELGEYKMIITLKETRWSDGTALTAQDAVYTFKRLLNVNFDSEAAVLLFDIKNARAIKNGEKSIDDLGATAPETYKLEIEFERKIDYTQFLRNLSSPALVPLREDIVAKASSGDTWAKKAATAVTSGPFTLRVIEFEGIIRLERSSYYLLSDKDKYLDKYVIPYRLETDYSTRTGVESKYLSMIDSQTAFFTNEIPLDKREAYKDSATITDLMSTHTLYLNLNNDLFKNEKVRLALSAALDRQQIANEVVFARPATGFIPYKVTDGKVGTSFREAGDAKKTLISTTADTAKAQALLNEAGVHGGNIRIFYFADDPVSELIAKKAEAAWTALGFTATAYAQAAYRDDTTEEVIYIDKFHDYYSVDSAESGSWDVLAIDYQMLSEEAFTALAPFAVGFSGNGVDMMDDTYPATGHMTGFAADDYNAKIEEAYAETDLVKRAEILHEAEELLLSYMPVIPVIFNQDAYYYNSAVVSGFSSDYYGATDFNRVKMKNYMAWKEYLGG